MEINTVYISLKDYQELILENADLKEQKKKLEKEKEELEIEYERIEKIIFDDILENEDYRISKIEEFSYNDFYYRSLFDILKEKGYLFEHKIKNIIENLKREHDKKEKKERLTRSKK